MSHAADVNGHTVGQRIGYTRVSTVAQTLDQQNDALAKASVTKTSPTPCPALAMTAPAWPH